MPARNTVAAASSHSSWLPATSWSAAPASPPPGRCRSIAGTPKGRAVRGAALPSMAAMRARRSAMTAGCLMREQDSRNGFRSLFVLMGLLSSSGGAVGAVDVSVAPRAL